MCLRQEFISLARQPDSNVALLCRRFWLPKSRAEDIPQKPAWGFQALN
jgi:hypothetical protein